MAGFLHKLASFSRLILLDRLGSGLSDRGPTEQAVVTFAGHPASMRSG